MKEDIFDIILESPIQTIEIRSFNSMPKLNKIKPNKKCFVL